MNKAFSMVSTNQIVNFLVICLYFHPNVVSQLGVEIVEVDFLFNKNSEFEDVSNQCLH